MLLVFKLYTKEQLINYLTNELSEYKINNIDEYLMSHIEKDYEVISDILQLNDPYIFIHAVLYKLPLFLAKHKTMPDSYLSRNNFEKAFEAEIIDPLIKSPNQTYNDFKEKISVNNQLNEIQYLIEEKNDINFL